MTSTPTPSPTTSTAAAAPSQAGAPAVTTGQLAQLLGATLEGRADLLISSVGSLEEGAPGRLAFVRSQRHAARWAHSDAAAALVTQGVEVNDHDPETRALLFVPSADMAIVELLGRFGPPAPIYAPGVHPSAVVHPAARVAPTAHIGPNCTVSAGAEIADGAVLIAQVHLGAQAKLGERSTCHPGVVIGDRCVIGHDTTLHHNVSVGADGFGYLPHPETKLPVKVPHIGAVRIGNHVEIGAGSAIDRGKFADTVLEDHVKLDNLVQVAHNCFVGAGSILCALTGVGGSVRIGRGVTIGAQSGISDNMSIGDGTMLAAKTGVMHHLPANEIWGGVPAEPGAHWLKAHAAVKKLLPHVGTLRKLAEQDRSADKEPANKDQDDTKSNDT